MLITRLHLHQHSILLSFPGGGKCTVEQKLSQNQSFTGIWGLFSRSGFSTLADYFYWVAFLLLSSIFWAVYTVFIKIVLRNTDSLSATVNIFLFPGTMYLSLSILTGGVYEMRNSLEGWRSLLKEYLRRQVAGLSLILF